MFGEETADSLPPCAISLISHVMDSPYLTREVYSELLEDVCILNRNCWRIYKRSQVQKETGVSLESLWIPILRLVCQQCTRSEESMQLEALEVLEELMCDESLLLLPASTYNSLISQTFLPTMKDVLLQVTGISHSTEEKPRVTRMRENKVLERLDQVIFNVLQLRFESLLVMEGFTTLWLQIMSILQFIQTVSMPDGSLRQENEKAVASILRHANTFGLFRVVKKEMKGEEMKGEGVNGEEVKKEEVKKEEVKGEEVKEDIKERETQETKEECSELWRHTVNQLSSFKEEMLKEILV